MPLLSQLILKWKTEILVDEKMIEQKMDYLHRNPVSGRWNLIEDYSYYPHSSAEYYELGKENKYITHYKSLNPVSSDKE